MEDKALTQIFNDIYSKVLQLSENPSQFAEYLTLQIRELIGSRNVVIAVKTETGETEIFSVYPQRRRDWANQHTVIKLAELSFNFKNIQFLEQEKCSKECLSLLQSLEIEKAIAIPLIAANRIIGAILLLDIMDIFGIESVLNLLEKLSGVFALVIRNAHLYHEMENLVMLRTKELQNQNEELVQREEELQSLNEEYLVINEELSETLKKADELNLTLKESEERYKSLVNNIPVGVFRSNIQGEVLSANPAMAEIYGYNSVDELLKLPAKNYYSELNPRDIMIEKLRKTGYLLEYETQELKKDGSLIWVSANYKLINTKDSNLSNESYIDGVLIDITERKQIENAIIKSQQQLKAHIDHSPLATIERDSNFIVTRWAGASEKIFGWTEKEVLGKSIMDLNMIFEDDLPIVQEIMERLSKSNSGNVVSSNRNYTKDRKVIYCEWYNTSLFDEHGNMISVMSQVLDVTDRKLAEESLHKSDDRFNLAMKASNDGLFDWNLETNEIYYSPGWKKMLGYKDHELPNDFSIWENLTEPEDVQKSWELQQKLINKQVDRFVMEFKMKHKNGHWVDILSRAEAIFNNNGKAIRIVGTHTDISDRKKGEITLRENEEKYRLLHENAGIGIGYYKPDGTIISYNKIAAKNMGGKPEDFAGKSIYEIFPKTEAEFYYSRIEKAGFSKKPLVYEDKVPLPNGDKYFLSTFSKITDSNNQILGIQIVSQNITHQKDSENELIKAKSLLEEAERIANVGSWDWNLKTNKTFWSDQLFEIYGRNKEEGVPEMENYLAQYHPDDHQKLEEEIEKAISGEKKYFIEFRIFRYNDGKERIIQSKGEVLFDENETPERIIGIAKDITKQKQAQTELTKAKEKAEESDRLKSAFLANMSHEIRTPMNGILGFTSLLQEPNLSGEEQQQYIEIIQKSGERMLNTVNDIIDISKIEAGQMNLTLSTVNVTEKVENLYSFFKPEAEKRGIQINLKNKLSKHESVIQTDKEKLDSILTNLAKNAIKYTDKGTIEFGVELKSDNNTNKLEFYIKDTGIGIPGDRQQAIFERFIQADIEDREARQGSGLGLAISKAYTEMLGGNIWLESEPGRGSVFYFTIPYQAKPQEKEEIKELIHVDENVGGIKKLNIVVAEDDPTSVTLLEIMLERVAKNIWITTTGTETVEVCRNNPDIDLVLMDIEMPNMNGFEATRQIRRFNTNVVICAQTAFALAGDKENAMEVGCNDYITKPINKEKLIEMILKYF